MANNRSRRIVEGVLSEAAGGDARFDVSARVEIWVTAEDIGDDRRYSEIVNSGSDLQARVASLKELAVTLASERLAEVSRGSGVEITVDSLALRDVNVDRIDWTALAASDQERRASEEAEFEP